MSRVRAVVCVSRVRAVVCVSALLSEDPGLAPLRTRTCSIQIHSGIRRRGFQNKSSYRGSIGCTRSAFPGSVSRLLVSNPGSVARLLVSNPGSVARLVSNPGSVARLCVLWLSGAVARGEAGGVLTLYMRSDFLPLRGSCWLTLSVCVFACVENPRLFSLE